MAPISAAAVASSMATTASARDCGGGANALPVTLVAGMPAMEPAPSSNMDAMTIRSIGFPVEASVKARFHIGVGTVHEP